MVFCPLLVCLLGTQDKIRNRQHNYDIEELRRYMQLRMCGNFRWLSNCRAGEEEAGKEEAAEPAGDGELLLDTASTDSDKGRLYCDSRLN